MTAMPDIRNLKVTMGLTVLVGLIISIITFTWQGSNWYHGVMEGQAQNTATILKKIDDLKNEQNIININTYNTVQSLRDSVKRLDYRLTKLDNN